MGGEKEERGEGREGKEGKRKVASWLFSWGGDAPVVNCGCEYVNIYDNINLRAMHTS